MGGEGTFAWRSAGVSPTTIARKVKRNKVDATVGTGSAMLVLITYIVRDRLGLDVPADVIAAGLTAAFGAWQFAKWLPHKVADAVDYRLDKRAADAVEEYVSSDEFGARIQEIVAHESSAIVAELADVRRTVNRIDKRTKAAAESS